MAFTPLTSGQCDADSALNEVLMQLIRTNFNDHESRMGTVEGLTVTNGDSHDHSGGDGATIPQGGLKTTITGEVSNLTATAINLTLPGGQYGFYPQTKSSHVDNTTGQAVLYCDDAASATSYISHICITGEGSGRGIYAQQRYIQASPPYDLGDGQIPLFIFALIDNASGKPVALYVAPEAPWHYNGPTDIKASHYKKGIPYRLEKSVIAENFKGDIDISAAIRDPAQRDGVLDRLRNDAAVEMEITQAIKNRDMSLIPHPFIANNLIGKTVVLIDPVSDFCGKLYDLKRAGEGISELIHEGYIDIDNISLTRSGPPGVTCVTGSWKNSV